MRAGLQGSAGELVGTRPPAGGLSSAAAAGERALRLAVEVVAGTLVAVETAILLAGVVSRYVFHNPLTWSDEFASILFLWLALFGAAVALRRGDHMRLTTVASLLPPALRAVAEATDRT